jgi:hypothetical protein
MGHATNLIVVAGATVAVQVEGKSAGTGVATKLCQSTSGVYLDCVATRHNFFLHYKLQMCCVALDSAFYL